MGRLGKYKIRSEKTENSSGLTVRCRLGPECGRDQLSAQCFHFGVLFVSPYRQLPEIFSGYSWIEFTNQGQSLPER